MSSPEELLDPLKAILGDLVVFAHERYSDAVKSSGAVVEHLRLVAAAEAFQAMAAVQQISQAVHNLERAMGDVDYWTRQADQLLTTSAVEADPEPLKMPRALTEPEYSPPLRYGSWSEVGEYLLTLGEQHIQIWPAGDAGDESGVMITVDGQRVVLIEPVWAELRGAVDWLMVEPPPMSAKGAETER